MDIGKSFSFPFEDENWLSKSLIGAVVAAIPIVNFAWMGYLVDLVRNVMAGSARPLPDWGDFGDKWVRGLLLTLASMIYAIPIIILACIAISLGVGVSAQAQGDWSDQMAGLFAGVGGVITCLIVLYGLLLSFILPAIFINYARNSTFASLFEFSRIFKIISDELSQYLTAWVVSLVAGIVVGLVVGVIGAVLSPILCLGQILAWVLGAVSSVYLYYIYGHLFGQVGAAQGAPLSPTNDITL